jgi:vancomycin permeability regulator SanA
MAIVESGGKFQSAWRKTANKIIPFVIVAIVLLLLIYMRVETKYRHEAMTVEQVPAGDNIGLVFGAGLKAKGVPGTVLADRVMKSLQLYQAGKVNQIVMSGDNSTANHNEVQAMKNLAIDEGLPEGIIVLDHAGLSTYDSCRQASGEFPGKKIVLITQKYHLKRALYICNELGVFAVGVAADPRSYPGQWRYTLREMPAAVVDWFTLLFVN